MEICGGQTRTIIQFGLDQLLPSQVRLLHGPGCPVCVTPVEDIDRAIELARRPGHILATFGDMVRVPGSRESLQEAKGRGADVRILYSPLDALTIARKNPDKEVVFFGIGFETSSVVTAAAVKRAAHLQLANFSLLCCHVCVPAAIEALLGASDNTVQAFIAPGHVCTVMGATEYRDLAGRFQVPFAIAGFEPVDILQGILQLIEGLESGTQDALTAVTIPYSRSVSPEGSLPGRSLLQQVFALADKNWRGIGLIPGGGLVLREEFQAFDARVKFSFQSPSAIEETVCRMGEVLRGVVKPPDCPAFARSCRPEHPLGAAMVSPEGACAIYYRFRSGAIDDSQEGANDAAS
jgi:hydrogenase expression/formation protein HypD